MPALLGGSLVSGWHVLLCHCCLLTAIVRTSPVALCLHPKWHPIPYITHQFWSEPYGPRSKVVHCILCSFLGFENIQSHWGDLCVCVCMWCTKLPPKQRPSVLQHVAHVSDPVWTKKNDMPYSFWPDSIRYMRNTYNSSQMFGYTYSLGFFFIFTLFYIVE